MKFNTTNVKITEKVLTTLPEILRKASVSFGHRRLFARNRGTEGLGLKKGGSEHGQMQALRQRNGGRGALLRELRCETRGREPGDGGGGRNGRGGTGAGYRACRERGGCVESAGSGGSCSGEKGRVGAQGNGGICRGRQDFGGGDRGGCSGGRQCGKEEKNRFRRTHCPRRTGTGNRFWRAHRVAEPRIARGALSCQTVPCAFQGGRGVKRGGASL